MKYVGADYLIWLGIRAIRGRAEEDAEVTAGNTLSDGSTRGVVVKVLNPKTALFFLAFRRSS